MTAESAIQKQGNGVFEIQQEGATLVILPVTNLGELAYQQIESGAEIIMDRLDHPSVRNVVLDMARSDYFGTTAIGFFLKLWKKVGRLGGHMAFCNLSDHEREILRLTKLDTLWTICESREEALNAIQRNEVGP